MIALPWDAEQAAYVAAVLREEAQRKVASAAMLMGDSRVKDLQVDLADRAIMIKGMATDLEAAVTNERGEDDLAGTTDGRVD